MLHLGAVYLAEEVKLLISAIEITGEKYGHGKPLLFVCGLKDKRIANYQDLLKVRQMQQTPYREMVESVWAETYPSRNTSRTEYSPTVWLHS